LRVIRLGIAALILFLIIDAAWLRWGFVGTFILVSAVLLVIAWFYDRRQAKIDEQYDLTTG
jgi:hypothetical protein